MLRNTKWNASYIDDEVLYSLYKETQSVKQRSNDIKMILMSHGISFLKSSIIVKQLFPYIVPAGVKSKIKGDVFNRLVKDKLEYITKRSPIHRLQVYFETPCVECQEIPDWYIEDTTRKRLYIGYNQIDMWSGGHQVNRCGKYVMDDTLHRRLGRKGIRMICVVAKDIPLHAHTKVACMLRKGVSTKRLCHISDLEKTLSSLMCLPRKKTSK